MINILKHMQSTWLKCVITNTFKYMTYKVQYIVQKKMFNEIKITGVGFIRKCYISDFYFKIVKLI